MSYIEETTFLGVRCDKRSCTAEVRPWDIRRGDYFGSRERCRQAAEDRGWTFWVGRSTRVYCPHHGPTTKMRRLTPSGGAS